MSQQRRPSAEKDRLRQSRQILAGNAVRPSPDPWARSDSAIPFTALQRNYVIGLIVLLLIGAGLAIIMDSLLLASIPFFLLALGLIAARFVF